MVLPEIHDKSYWRHYFLTELLGLYLYLVKETSAEAHSLIKKKHFLPWCCTVSVGHSLITTARCISRFNCPIRHQLTATLATHEQPTNSRSFLLYQLIVCLPSKMITRMYSPSPQLLRALGAGVPRRFVHHCSTNRHTAIHHGVWSTPNSTHGVRSLSSASSLCQPHRDASTGPSRSRDRGPRSDEDTQTDFGALNILGNMGTPATSIDACVSDGFHLNNGLKTSDGSGIVLVGGEAFSWRPWEATPTQKPLSVLGRVGTLEIGGSSGAWGLLELLWPKPDLLVLGTGGKVWPLSKETREYLNGLGVRIDVMNTRNASAAYNLLATERGTDIVAAAMLPMGWKGS